MFSLYTVKKNPQTCTSALLHLFCVLGFCEESWVTKTRASGGVIMVPKVMHSGAVNGRHGFLVSKQRSQEDGDLEDCWCKSLKTGCIPASELTELMTEAVCCYSRFQTSRRSDSKSKFILSSWELGWNCCVLAFFWWEVSSTSQTAYRCIV